MKDVRALQTILDGGITDPETILTAMPEPGLDPIEATMLIPDDGQEHDCRCGFGPYSVWHSGWVPRLVTGFEGEPTQLCTGCGAELEPADA